MEIKSLLQHLSRLRQMREWTLLQMIMRKRKRMKEKMQGKLSRLRRRSRRMMRAMTVLLRSAVVQTPLSLIPTLSEMQMAGNSLPNLDQPHPSCAAFLPYRKYLINMFKHGWRLWQRS